MKKGKVRFLPTGIALVLLCAAMCACSAMPKQQISQEFAEIKQKMDRIAPYQDATLVEGEHVRITMGEFLFYKSNLEMLYRIEDQAFTLTDDELIDEMLKRRLAVQYAKQVGLSAAAQEIDEVIARERKALYDPGISGDNKAIVKEIMDNRIRITGISEEAFWNSEDVRKSYEDAILLGKLYSHLQKERNIQSAEDFAQFQNELLQEAKKSLTIHRELLAGQQ